MAFDISAATSVNLQFTNNDLATSSAFYIDNILIKDLGTTLAISTNTVLNENFSGSSYPWIATNAGISYGTGQMHVSGTPPVLQYAGVARTLDLMPGEIYRVRFDLTAKSVGTGTMSFAFSGGSATQYGSYDYSQPMTNGITTYTFYVTPNTVQSTFYINVTSPSSSFSWDIDNFIVEMSTASPKPLYTAVANDLTDYYAFGAPMPGRSYHASAANAYRYGFNGKENDANIASTGDGAQDYGMRIYNPSLGKFLSVDPLFREYAYYTPYQFSGNTPIAAIDRDGLENVYIVTQPDKTEVMRIVYTQDHINAMIEGNSAIPLRIFYNGDKQGTDQFDGPNKQNEEAVFRMHAVKLNGAVCKDVDDMKEARDHLYEKEIKLKVPKPSPKPTISHPIKTFVNMSADRNIIIASTKDPVSGFDDEGQPAKIGHIGKLLRDDIAKYGNDVANNPTIKSIDVTVMLPRDYLTPETKVNESAATAADNIKALLYKSGVSTSIPINTYSGSYDETDKAHIPAKTGVIIEPKQK